MSDVTTAKPKTARPAGVVSGSDLPKFEIPRFEMPKFEVPKMEVPAAFREFAEKGVTQCKESWEKMKAVSEEASDLIETSYATAAKGYADYGQKVIEAARVNTNAQFDYAAKLMTVKSLSEVMELSTAHMRSQYEALTGQTKELTALDRHHGRCRDANPARASSPVEPSLPRCR